MSISLPLSPVLQSPEKRCIGQCHEQRVISLSDDFSFAHPQRPGSMKMSFGPPPLPPIPEGRAPTIPARLINKSTEIEKKRKRTFYISFEPFYLSFGLPFT